MILLDSNYLIAGIQQSAPEARALAQWRRSGEPVGTSAIAWSEFLCGPVRPGQVADIEALLDGGILPFTAAEATEAARLFNAAGRKRALRVDSMIAATAVLHAAHLATRNLDDFQPFVPHGLQLA